ncbi:hypothetical protein ACHAXS_003356 [Conticribra weissflogii]
MKMIPFEHHTQPQQPEREQGQRPRTPPHRSLLLRSPNPRIPSPWRRRGRRRQSLLLVLPMAMIVLGAGPSRPLSLNGNHVHLPSFRGRGPGGGGQTGHAGLVGGGSSRREKAGHNVPFGPLPRGGSRRDLTVYDYHWDSSSSSSSSPSSPSYSVSSAAAATAAAMAVSPPNGTSHGAATATRNRGPFTAVRSASRKLRRSVIRLAVRPMNVDINVNVSQIVSNINFPANFKRYSNGSINDRKNIQTVMETVDTLDGWGNVHDLASMEVTSSSRAATMPTSRRHFNHGGKQIKVRKAPPRQQNKLLPLSGMGRLFYRSSRAFGADIRRTEHARNVRRIASSYDKAAKLDYDGITESFSDIDSRTRDSSHTDSIPNASFHAKAAMPVRGGGSGTSMASSKAPAAPATSPTTVTQTTDNADNWIIDTPLFPIILPKGWEPPSVPHPLATRDVVPSTESNDSMPSPTMEISVQMMQEQLDRTLTQPSSDIGDEAPPSQHLLRAATLPLIPKATFDTFTGREFYHYETIDGLARTGLRMAGGNGVDAVHGRDATVWKLSDDCGIVWTGEKKTVKFLNDLASSLQNDDSDYDGGSGGYSSNYDSTGDEEDVDGIGRATAIPSTRSQKWYHALDTSQEVLVWTGKFTDPNTNGNGNINEGFGADIPIIKTTSIIHKSPKFLAELLMDSEKVKVYNKMSLGRTDEMVFQKGVDTVAGRFGDGETKVVRNLTKPPMVNSIIEFVSEYLYLAWKSCIKPSFRRFVFCLV